MPLVRVTILSDKLAKLLQGNEFRVQVEPGTYSIAELIDLIPTQVHSIKSIIDKMGEAVFIAVNGRVRYNLDEKIEVMDDIRVTV